MDSSSYFSPSHIVYLSYFISLKLLQVFMKLLALYLINVFLTTP